MNTAFKVPRHYESHITVANDPRLGRTITKRYRDDVPAVRWLNAHLSQYYDPSDGWPVAQHEFAALSLLLPFGIAPRPLELRPDAVVMTFSGTPLPFARTMSRKDYAQQAARILAILSDLGFRHNDLLANNVLVDRGQLKIIDFTMSEFGAIQSMASLPDRGWARPGQDRMLLDHWENTHRGSGGHATALRRIAALVLRIAPHA